MCSSDLLADRPSVIPYGPRSGSEDVTNPILRWFAGSDDRSNLTFDVYLGTNSNPTTKVASNITTFYYTTSNLTLNTYYWKVVAKDELGSVTSSIMNFTRINNAPSLSNYTLSSSSVVRTSTIAIGVNATDYQDSESALTVLVQYRSTSGGWQKGYLSTLWYDSSDSRWETNFTPASSAALGDYDIRIMVNDTDGASTGWNSYSDVITVNNNNPPLQNYGLSASSVLRTESTPAGSAGLKHLGGGGAFTIVMQDGTDGKLVLLIGRLASVLLQQSYSFCTVATQPRGSPSGITHCTLQHRPFSPAKKK